MNTEFPSDPREALEASLTALLLDELPADQAAFMRQAIAQDAELARRYERLKSAIELVRLTESGPSKSPVTQPPALKLSDQRRQELLQRFKTLAPKAFAQPKQRETSWLVPAGVAALLVAVLAAGLLPALSRPKSRSMASVNRTLRERNLDERTLNRTPQSALTPGQSSAYRGVEDKLRAGALPQAVEPAQARTKIVLPASGDEGGKPKSELDVLSEARRNVRSALPRADGAELAKSFSTDAKEMNPVAGLPANSSGAGTYTYYGGGAFGGYATITPSPQGTPVGSVTIQGVGEVPVFGELDASADRKAFMRRYGLVDRGGIGGVGQSAGGSAEKNLGELPTNGSQGEPTLVDPSTGLPVQTAAETEKFAVSLPSSTTSTQFSPDGRINSLESKLRENRTSEAPQKDSFGKELVPGLEAPAVAAYGFGTDSVKRPTLGDEPTLGNLFKSTGKPSEEHRSSNSSSAPSPSTFPTMGLSPETLRRVEQLRVESSSELARRQTNLESLSELKPENLAQAIARSNAADAEQNVLNLNEQLTIANKKLATLNQSGMTNPESARVSSEVDGLRRKINDASATLRLGLLAGIDSLEQGVDDLDKEIQKAKAGEQNLDQPQRQQTGRLQESLERLPAEQPDAPQPRPVVPPQIPQPEVQTHEHAFSTFSLNVSDVSFKLAAASLEKGVMPEPAGIRAEEFINAFDYRDPEPAPGAPFAFAWERVRYPFAHNRDLLRFSLKTASQGRQAGRPLNLVLLLDNSGSMERADRVRIIHEALRVLAAQLQPQDMLSVVTFARTARLWVDGVPGSQAGQIAEELSGLTPQGGTNLEEAMNLGYQTALRHYRADGINRVVLLTDGAANLGDVDAGRLKAKVETNRKQGIALDCFGIGWEGYNDDLLEVLTRNGDGRYGFINTPEEAASEFAGQLAGALHVAASDVKVQVEFNPNRVTVYRQIGYAKHQLTKEQFRDNTVDAAELGSAESGNALYVIEINAGGEGPLATVRVRFKVPGTAEYPEHAWEVPYTGNAVPLEQASPATRLAASTSAFAEWLASSPYATEVTPDALLGHLGGVPEVYGADARPKRLEWMIRQAKSLSGK